MPLFVVVVFGGVLLALAGGLFTLCDYGALPARG
jgi:hypothetical protein